MGNAACHGQLLLARAMQEDCNVRRACQPPPPRQDASLFKQVQATTPKPATTKCSQQQRCMPRAHKALPQTASAAVDHAALRRARGGRPTDDERSERSVKSNYIAQRRCACQPPTQFARRAFGSSSLPRRWGAPWRVDGYLPLGRTWARLRNMKRQLAHARRRFPLARATALLSCSSQCLQFVLLFFLGGEGSK